MSARNDVKVGTDMQHVDMVTGHGHAAKTAIIARIAVFEGKNTLQSKYAFVVPLQFHRPSDHGFVQKLQAFILAGIACRQNPDFARLEAIQPKPHGSG